MSGRRNCFSADYSFGIESENKVKPTLDKFFNESYEKTSKFHPIDFKGRGSWVEVKTRTFEYSKYPTTMLPASKIEFAKTCENSVYFVFVFTDGIYYIQYDTEVFSKFEVKPFTRTGRYNSFDKQQDYIYIPTALLTKIHY